MGELGEEQRVELGIPQGSNLAPLLFIIYTNDLKSELKYGKVFAFADDLAIITAHRNIKNAEKNTQNDLLVVSRGDRGYLR